ncbi:MAG: hypothetical protein ACXITV_07065 [Luteibaculaceae bacterium]
MTTTLKYSYKPRILRFYGFIALAWSILLVVSLAVADTKWFSYLFYAINALVWGTDFYLKRKRGYVQFTKQQIIIYNFLGFTQKIKVNEILSIRELFGDILVKTSKKEFTLSKDLLLPDDLEAVKTQLTKLQQKHEPNHA